MKKVFSLVLFVILTVAVSVTAFAADSDIIASGYCGGEGDGTNLEWVLTADGTLTISGEGKMECYKSTNNGKQITSAPWGEYSDHLKTLVIEEGVTNIGCCAFAFCSGFEGTLVIPNSVTIIEDSAFVLCSGFTGNLVIPNNVTEIGWYAFDKCDGFNGKLIIGKGITNIGVRAFYGCSKLTGNLFIHNDEISIGSLAFCNCGINNYYFGGDAPEMVRIPGESIIYDHFDKTDDTIYYPSGNSTWEIVDGKWNGYNAVPYEPYIASGYCGGEGDGTNLEWVLTEDGTLTISGTGKMADYETWYGPDESYTLAPWGEYKNQINFLVLEEGITRIGDNAFGLMGIEGELIIPSTVKSIGTFSFEHNSFSQKNLVIPEGVENIGDSAFQAVGDFGYAYIPSTVTDIGGSPFRYCSLEEIVVHEDNPNFCAVDGVLFSKDQTVIYQFPQTRTGEYIVPDSVNVVGEGAFEEVYLSKIIFNSDIESIGNSAFSFNQKDIKIIFKGKVGSVMNAVMANFANAEIFFLGGAPESVRENSDKYGCSFGSNMGKTYTIYYVDDGSWSFDENGLWNGYEVNEYSGYGDLNSDFTVDVKDVYLARLAAAKLVVPTEEEFSLGDVDGNGRINAIDANLIRKFCANIITKFPVGG